MYIERDPVHFTLIRLQNAPFGPMRSLLFDVIHWLFIFFSYIFCINSYRKQQVSDVDGIRDFMQVSLCYTEFCATGYQQLIEIHKCLLSSAQVKAMS